ncbi:hypothetical protein SPD48_05140 [Pseudogracilibacillus sp. SE30717A]|uniref:hypothetical protein n=1 Tax=Pseudogracilibacillus sp. SE30717A TaxID=3098293 RepID=UPI00300E30D9
MKQFIASAVVLFSESVWIYFLFGLFMSVEWNEPTFVNAIWWVVAGVLGFLINRLVAGNTHYVLALVINALVLLFIVIQNWKAAVPEGSWVAGIFFSIAVLFLYVRSASFVYKSATRMHMLQRFEFSIFIYLALLFIFTFNDWINEYFHPAFLAANFSTLLGMILTLDTDMKTGENKQVDVYKAGNPGGFITVISLLFTSVVVISSALFLPAVREKLQQITYLCMNGVSWIFSRIWQFISWVFGLFEPSEIDGTLPEAEPQTPIEMGEMQEEITSLPIGWLFVGISVLIVILVLVILGYFLKNWRPSEQVSRLSNRRNKNRFNWRMIQQKIWQFIQRLKMRYRARFARFYKQEVFWYFNQVLLWGKKHGITRDTSETSEQFIEKLIERLEIVQVSEHEKKQVIQELREITHHYQAAYYGNKNVSGDYTGLLNRLKSLKMKKVL